MLGFDNIADHTQHHLPPPRVTYTTDAPETTNQQSNEHAADPNQTTDVFVAEQMREPGYIIGSKPGVSCTRRFTRSVYLRVWFNLTDKPSSPM